MVWRVETVLEHQTAASAASSSKKSLANRVGTCWGVIGQPLLAKDTSKRWVTGNEDCPYLSFVSCFFFAFLFHFEITYRSFTFYSFTLFLYFIFSSFCSHVVMVLRPHWAILSAFRFAFLLPFCLFSCCNAPNAQTAAWLSNLLYRHLLPTSVFSFSFFVLVFSNQQLVVNKKWTLLF